MTAAATATTRPCKVIERLFLGDSGVSRNREVLREEGIGAIVNVARECSNHFEGELVYVHIPLEDSPHQDIRGAVETASRAISATMGDNTSVLVHCAAGDSRAPAVCIGFLMCEKKATLLQAWKLVRRARAFARPSHHFFVQLVALENDLFGHNTMMESDYSSAVAS